MIKNNLYGTLDNVEINSSSKNFRHQKYRIDLTFAVYNGISGTDGMSQNLIIAILGDYKSKLSQ